MNLTTFSNQVLFSRVYWGAHQECTEFYDKRYDRAITDGQRELCRQKIKEMRLECGQLFKDTSLEIAMEALDLFLSKEIENKWWLESPHKV